MGDQGPPEESENFEVPILFFIDSKLWFSGGGGRGKTD